MKHRNMLNLMKFDMPRELQPSHLVIPKLINCRKRTRRGGADSPALNIKVASSVVVLGINVLIVQQTNAFVTNAIARAISQKFVYQKLRKSRRRLRQCVKTKKSTRTSVH